MSARREEVLGIGGRSPMAPCFLDAKERDEAAQRAADLAAARDREETRRLEGKRIREDNEHERAMKMVLKHLETCPWAKLTRGDNRVSR